MYKKFFLLLVCFARIAGIYCQEEYLIGSSVASIEPDRSTFSVALAGYGAPREGRFTIEWKYHGKAPAVSLIAAIGKSIYGLDENNNLLKASTDNINTWKQHKIPNPANI